MVFIFIFYLLLAKGYNLVAPLVACPTANAALPRREKDKKYTDEWLKILMNIEVRQEIQFQQYGWLLYQGQMWEHNKHNHVKKNLLSKPQGSVVAFLCWMYIEVIKSNN